MNLLSLITLLLASQQLFSQQYKLQINKTDGISPGSEISFKVFKKKKNGRYKKLRPRHFSITFKQSNKTVYAHRRKLIVSKLHTPYQKDTINFDLTITKDGKSLSDSLVIDYCAAQVSIHTPTVKRSLVGLLINFNSGKDGPNGKDILVRVDTLVHKQYVRVKIFEDNIKTPKTYYLDKHRGHLTVLANGGDGEQGSRGYKGSNGNCPGDGEMGGDGGNGSDVYVFYPKSMQRFAKLQIKILNHGGKGGDGGNGGKLEQISKEEQDYKKTCTTPGRDGQRGNNGYDGQIKYISE